jgi:Zn-dependent membrane protease YugP
MFEDPIFWLFTAPGLILGFYAQSMIKKNYIQYSKIPSLGGVTGAEAARRMLDSQGLTGVVVEPTPGVLSDHYDPRTKTLRLSKEVYYTPSLSSEGIAAHETGHALQDADNYFLMEIRTLIVPLVAGASRIAPFLFFGGFMVGIPEIAWVGVAMFGASTLFALITLPVELNASRRAKDLLVSLGMVQDQEQLAGIKSVLRSAAWTYVAGVLSAMGSLFYFAFILLSSGRRR